MAIKWEEDKGYVGMAWKGQEAYTQVCAQPPYMCAYTQGHTHILRANRKPGALAGWGGSVGYSIVQIH